MWNAAVAAAGIGEASRRDISSVDLFDNLRDVWDKAQGFLVFVEQAEQLGSSAGEPPLARGPRDPSLRLRFLVMRRDSFKCRHCGRSPALHPGLELHVDHVAWSSGGVTAAENLQTLCSNCNLGKSDLDQHDGAG
jgi:HNH endonuclease